MNRANAKVIEALNDVLTAELTAINQYFIHAKMLANWRYDRLAAYVRHESIDEMKHADAVIDRILYLGGVPNMQRLSKINVGETVPEQFQCDKALEEAAIPRLNHAVALCREEGDNGTRALLEKILTEEEEHLDWLEAQLEQIDAMGLGNYLAEQIRE